MWRSTLDAPGTAARRTPDEVMQALTNGLMRAQRNPCTGERAPAAGAAASWNGWGRDLDNSRYQPEPGLTAAAVPHLKVKWAFGYRATYTYGQPTIAGGRVYVTSSAGASILSTQRRAAPTGRSTPRRLCAPPYRSSSSAASPATPATCCSRSAWTIHERVCIDLCQFRGSLPMGARHREEVEFMPPDRYIC